MQWYQTAFYDTFLVQVFNILNRPYCLIKFPKKIHFVHHIRKYLSRLVIVQVRKHTIITIPVPDHPYYYPQLHQRHRQQDTLVHSKHDADLLIYYDVLVFHVLPTAIKMNTFCRLTRYTIYNTYVQHTLPDKLE